MIFYYYAEIYKIFKDFKEALKNYQKSKNALDEYKYKKKKQREASGSSMLTQISSFNPATRIFT